jgi:hypothetical protein
MHDHDRRRHAGQAAAVLSLISFALAGAMEVTALAFIFSWFLSWLGLSMQAAVAILVASGISSCAIVILILLGVLSDAYSYKSCVDQQSGSGTVVLGAQPMRFDSQH